MTKFDYLICSVCEYIYNEEDTGMVWEQLPKYWNCPHCGSAKEEFVSIQQNND